jgi:hypothetical protein
MLWGYVAPAQALSPICTLAWQTPAQGAITNILGPQQYTLSVTCPSGVNPASYNYQLWGGCYDSGEAVPAGYTNYYTETGGAWNATTNPCTNSPLANSATAPNGGVLIFPSISYNPSTQSGTISFTYDFTQVFPQSSIEDINVTSLWDSALSDYDVATLRNCEPNDDCDTTITVGAPAATPTVSRSGALAFASPVQGANESGTIAVSIVNVPSDDYVKVYLPNAPVNGNCAIGQYDSAWSGGGAPFGNAGAGCSLYTSSFNFNSTLVPNGQSGFYATAINSSGGTDATATVTFTVAISQN